MRLTPIHIMSYMGRIALYVQYTASPCPCGMSQLNDTSPASRSQRMQLAGVIHSTCM